jgi:hypothetical protein
MEEQMFQILIEVSKGEKSPELAQTELLCLFSVMPRSYGIVRWHDNEHEDVVCVNRETADEYVRKYNELAGFAKCYVDEDIWLPLNEA